MAVRSISRSDVDSPGASWRRRGFELLGVALLIVALALAIALWGHDPNDPSLNNATSGPSTNPLGHFGASVADVLKQTLGLASWTIPLVLPMWGLRLILGRPLRWPWLPIVALPLALLAAAAYLATWPLSEQWPYWVGLEDLLHAAAAVLQPDDRVGRLAAEDGGQRGAGRRGTRPAGRKRQSPAAAGGYLRGFLVARGRV